MVDYVAALPHPVPSRGRTRAAGRRDLKARSPRRPSVLRGARRALFEARDVAPKKFLANRRKIVYVLRRESPGATAPGVAACRQ